MRACRTWLLAVGAVLIVGAAVLLALSQQGSPDEISDIDAFATALELDGFTVQEGAMGVIPIIDLYNIGVLPSCYGNNPSTPYVMCFVPPPPGQPLAAGDSQGAGSLDGETLIEYRLRPDEAIVMIGRTPPTCSYFSYRSYIYDRFSPIQGSRERIFASLGDTLNLLTIKTSGTPDGQSGDPFDQMTMIVVTADRGIDQRIREAAEAFGISHSIINTDVIPSALVTMGLDTDADRFLILLRLAFFQDWQAGQSFMHQPPMQVFRCTPTAPTTLDAYDVPDLRVRGTGDMSEFGLLGALEELRQAILVKHGAANATELGTRVWLYEGFDAMQRGIDVIGENRDTVYLRSEDFTLADDPGEFVIVYGVNHEATGKVIYSNFGVYGATALNGVGAVSNAEFAGTAEAYLPGNPLAEYLYVWKLSRCCDGESNCLAVPWGVKAYGVDLDEPAFIAFRAYVEPETMVGPSWSEIVYDRVIRFSTPD